MSQPRQPLQVNTTTGFEPKHDDAASTTKYITRHLFYIAKILLIGLLFFGIGIQQESLWLPSSLLHHYSIFELHEIGIMITILSMIILFMNNAYPQAKKQEVHEKATAEAPASPASTLTPGSSRLRSNSLPRTWRLTSREAR